MELRRIDIMRWNHDEYYEYPLKETKTYFWVNLEVYREILNNMDSMQY